MKRHLFPLLILMLDTSLAAAPVYALPSAQDIVREADQAKSYAESGMEGHIGMTSSVDGSSSARELAVKVAPPGVLVEFSAPAKVSGQKVLTRGRNMWYIRPGVKKPVPISPRQRLFGDASNGDIASTRFADDYQATLLREEPLDGEPCHVLELKANDKSVTYDRIVYWVSTRRGLALQSEFYGLSGKLIKTARYEYGNRIELNGHSGPFISRMSIQDAVNRSAHTVMDYSGFGARTVDAGLFNPDIYTE